MLRKMLISKIHRATVTQCDPDYVGSITIDSDLLRASGMRPNECVLVSDIDNGSRFETYVLAGEAGSGIIGLNGAAAKLVCQGDKIIIFSFGQFEHDQIENHIAHVVLVDDHNRIDQILAYPTSLEDAPILA